MDDRSLSVTEAMTAAKSALEGVRVTVVGEVSEFNDKPGYKAAYFTVADGSASMPCLMWRNKYEYAGVPLRPGLLVQLKGYFSAYVPKGRMQFSVDSLSLAGEGDLRLKVAQIAKRLEAEGLMAPSSKKPIPPMPMRIAVVTSPRGKAIHDVMRTLRRRFPLAELLIAGVPVEGETAPTAIISGLEAAIESSPDVILLVRGGGSYEDLMPFNDEVLARYIASIPVPIVTGIGHEPDTSIADMVSDLRASTPTAAAEAVTPALSELESRVQHLGRALGRGLQTTIVASRHRLEQLKNRPVFSDTSAVLGPYAQTLDIATSRLKDLSPHAILSRGYSITYNKKTGAVIRGTRDVSVGDDIRIRVASGQLDATTNDVQDSDSMNESVR